MTMKTGAIDPYKTLGLRRGAEHDEIRRAYFRLVREHPPESDPETFKAIRAAYEQLRSSEQRVRTDLYLLQPPPPWRPARVGSGSFDLSLPREAVLAAARALTDLGNDNPRADFRAVHL